MTRNLFTSHLHCSAAIMVAKKNVLLLSTAHYNNTSRVIAHALKVGDYNAIITAACRMAPCLPEDCVLVPAPGRHGFAKQTLKLAKMISRISGCPVADVLRGADRMANYEAKKKGIRLTLEDMGFYLDGVLPEDKTVVVVDNVIDRGTTAFAAANAIGTCVVLSYAMTSVQM